MKSVFHCLICRLIKYITFELEIAAKFRPEYINLNKLLHQNSLSHTWMNHLLIKKREKNKKEKNGVTSVQTEHYIHSC